MITWDDSMSTGLPEIDGQHKELIERYNTFAEALARDGFIIAEAGDLLDFLQFYAVWHFEREEHCFEQYQCPIAAANKEAHAQFIEMFGQFYEQWQQHGMDSQLIEETYGELGTWIENHIRRLDTQLLPCLKERA